MVSSTEFPQRIWTNHCVCIKHTIAKGVLGNQRVIAQEQLPSGKKERPSMSEESFQSFLRKL